MIVKSNFYSFLGNLNKKKNISKRKDLFIKVELFEMALYHLVGGVLNFIKLKLKRNRPSDLGMKNYIMFIEDLREFYEDVIVPVFNLYCIILRIDFKDEDFSIFFENIKKRGYTKPLIWFIKNPYKIFAVSIRNFLHKIYYA